MPGDDPQPVRTGLRSSPDMRLATSQFTAPRDEEYEISGLIIDFVGRYLMANLQAIVSFLMLIKKGLDLFFNTEHQQ